MLLADNIPFKNKTLMDKIRIVAFGASSSKSSINRKLALYAASLFEGSEIIAPDLKDFEMPLFSVDKEEQNGYPPEAQLFLEIMASADLIIISMAEHNGSYTAAFKNILDWCSRIEPKVFCGKPMLLLSTSPGIRAGGFVMEAAKTRFPRHSANIISSYSLPEFDKNFRDGEGISNSGELILFHQAVKAVKEALDSSIL